MKTLITLFKWDVILLHRNRLFVISAVLVATYLGAFKLLESVGDLSMFAVILIFNDPLTTGFVFGGVLMMFDRNQNTLEAIAILPISPKHYLISKASVLALLAVLMSWTIAYWVHGFDFQVLHLTFATFCNTFILALLGFSVGAISKNINQFILYSVPLLILVALPFLPLFDIGNRWLFCLFPSFGGVELIYQSLVSPSSLWLTTAAYLNILLWLGISWKLVIHITKKYWT